MRFVQRNLWPGLVLLLTGCSLVVDFPEPRDSGVSSRDGGTSTACTLGKNGTAAGCTAGEFCCEVEDQRGSACQKNDAMNCGGCGIKCDDERATQCGDDGCECEPGNGPCPQGQICSTAGGGAAECVGCDSDSDCTGTFKQCVNRSCVECDPSAENAGCSGNRPVCNAQGRCVGCEDNDDCGNRQVCNRGQGCFGCSVEDNTPCTGTTPTCKAVGSEFQCSQCTSNDECRRGTLPGFCDEAPAGTGSCHTECDPRPATPGGPNGCEATPTRPICKQVAGGSTYTCQPCALTDCGVGRSCVTAPTDPLVGSCVQCVRNEDCTNPAAPVCGANKMCRPRNMPGDCMAPTPVLLANGTCAECDASAANADAACATSTGGRYCVANRCVPCTMLPAGTTCTTKSPTTPLCNATSGVCVGCTSSATCPAATPICSGVTNQCVACTTVSTMSAMQNAACAAAAMQMTPATNNTFCMSGGTMPGACGACDPADNEPCTTGQTCGLVGGAYRCMLPLGPIIPGVDGGTPRPRLRIRGL